MAGWSLGTGNEDAELGLGVPRSKRLQPETGRYKLHAGLVPGRPGEALKKV